MSPDEVGTAAPEETYFEACGFGGQSGWLAIRWGREPKGWW